MATTEDVQVGEVLDPMAAGVEAPEGPEKMRLKRHSSFSVRRVMDAPRDTLVRVDRALTSTVDMPLVTGPAETVRKLGTSLIEGLKTSVAEERLKQYGPNELDKSRDPTILELVLLQVRVPGVRSKAAIVRL
jgi:magnesium-transporting ATPase (P-type)